MAWETDEELFTAWLGGYGPEKEAEAEDLLDELVAGRHGEEAQALGEAILADLDQYIAAGHSMGEDLAAELSQQEDEGESQEDDEDHFTGLMAAELERLADHVGRDLTPEEADSLLNGIPEQARVGEAPFPDWVAEHGERLKGRVSNTEDRLELMAERGRQLQARKDAERDDGEPPESGGAGDSDEEPAAQNPDDNRLERMELVGTLAMMDKEEAAP